MEELDYSVLKYSCELANDINGMGFIKSGQVIEYFEKQGICKGDVIESLKYLYEQGLVRAQDLRVLHYHIAWSGYEHYAQNEIEDYEEIKSEVEKAIAEHDTGISSQIVSDCGVPHALVNHVIEGLAAENLIQIQKVGGGATRYYGVTVALKRRTR